MPRRPTVASSLPLAPPKLMMTSPPFSRMALTCRLGPRHRSAAYNMQDGNYNFCWRTSCDLYCTAVIAPACLVIKVPTIKWNYTSPGWHRATSGCLSSYKGQCIEQLASNSIWTAGIREIRGGERDVNVGSKDLSHSEALGELMRIPQCASSYQQGGQQPHLGTKGAASFEAGVIA